MGEIVTKISFLPLAVASVVMASPTMAATTVSIGVSGNIAPGQGSTPGHTLLCDFNVGSTNRCEDRLSGTGAYSIRNGDSNTGRMGNGTGFLNVTSGTAVLSLSGLDWRNISFDWGTPDTYNFIQLIFANNEVKTFNAQDVFNAPFPSNNQIRRVTFSASNVIESIAFGSLQTAGEYDNVMGSVPEPGTWLLMILGLGAVGFAMRRRQTVSVRYQFA